MENHSKNKNSSKYNHKSSWLATMFHLLDFHYWRTKNHSICWKTPRAHSLHEKDEQEPFLDSNPKRQETNKMITTKQVTEYVDFLEILRKEDVFVKILKDPNSEFGKRLFIKSNPRVLPKSSSFPLSSSSRPSSIDHKLREYWYTPKQNETVLTLNVPKESRTPNSHAVIKGFREIKKLFKNALKDLKHTKKKKKSKFSDVLNGGRYSQLLEHSFRRSGGELSSRSLRLSSYEDDKPQFFRRVSSLSRLEVLGSFLTDLSHDSSSMKFVDQDTDFGSKKTFLLSESLVRNDEEQEERSKEDHLDSLNHIILQQDQDSVPKTGFLDNTALLSQGLKPVEVNNHEEDTYFNYVKKVLEASCLIENNIEQWYSEEQPLNPLMLFELETQEETVNTELLIFDLVNEAIAETHNQSHMYFPKPFSFEKRFLDEVWGRVEWSITGLGDEIRDVSLDDIVGRDLSNKGDGWMNLSGEHEWIILELEDMIFDDVLDELLCVYS